MLQVTFGVGTCSSFVPEQGEYRIVLRPFPGSEGAGHFNGVHHFVLVSCLEAQKATDKI